MCTYKCVNFPVKSGDNVIEELGRSHENPIMFKHTTLKGGTYIYHNADARSYMSRAARSLIENDTFSNRGLMS